MAEKTSMLGALAGSLAHELNQPLCATKLNIDTLKQVASEQPEAKLLTDLLNDVEKDNLRVERIVKRVDKLFRRGSSVFTPINLSQLVHDCCDLLAKDMEKRHVALHINVHNDIVITGDYGQLETVVLNLLTNAKDALGHIDPPRRINVMATLEGPTVSLIFSDNGRGIDPLATEQVFDPFYTTKEHGMGIGLWLTKSILEHHNARIAVKNNAEGGATFEVTFLNHQTTSDTK
jgi:two-component system sensor kinase FixL